MPQKTKPKQVTSLEKFASAIPFRQGRACSICSLPEIEQINAGKLKGDIAAHTIVSWLRTECGHKHITLPMVENHFRRRHHQRELFE